MFDLWAQTPRTLAALVMRQAATLGPKAALVEAGHHRDGGNVTSFEMLHQQILMSAQRLKDAGVCSGDYIAIYHPLNRDFIIGILAAWHVGAVVVLPDPLNPEMSLRTASSQMPFRAVLANRRFCLRYRLFGKKHLGRAIVPGAIRPKKQKPPTEAEKTDIEIAADVPDIALITLAVNAKGYMHGIQRSHQQILDTHASLTGILDVRPSERCYVNMMLPMLSVLAEGGSVLVPGANRPVADQQARFWQQIAEQGATSLVVTAAVLDAIVANGQPEDYRLNQIDRITSFGPPIFPDVQDRLCLMAPWCRIDHVYTSEAAGPVAMTRFGTRTSEDLLATSIGRGILSGGPLAEYRVAILPDDFGVPLGGFSTAEFVAWCLPVGETGEIVVACDYDMPSFWQGRGEFENAFMVDDQRWYRTGDAGFIDMHGRIWHQGRCQARITDKLGTVYPMAIEAAARAQIGPMKIACVDAQDGPVLVIEQNSQLDHDALCDVLSATGIGRIVVMDKIPVDKSRGNRVDYRRLAILLAARRNVIQVDASDEPVR